MNAHTTKPSDDADKSSPLAYARQAMTQMSKFNIEPTPMNYAVWYAYVSGASKELNKEIESVASQSMPFSLSINEYLYHKYVADNEDKRILEDTTVSAKNLLAEILKVINEFSGHTDSYNREVEDHVQKLTRQVANTGFEDMVKEIISSAAQLKKSGDQLSQRLSESREEIQALKVNLNEISSEAQRDYLTNVSNRKALEKALEQQTEFARQNQSPLCLLMLDIDHFKQYNDRYGHLIGDEVLKIVAKHLVNSVKGKDFVARYGGEEFAVLLPSTPIEGAMVVADIIRKTIASSELKRKDTGEIFGSITISIGVSLFRPETDTIPLFIKRADDALYVAKKAGRNRVAKEA